MKSKKHSRLSACEVAVELGVCKQVMSNMAKVVVGKGDSIELMLVALIAEGHLLLDDVPGVGKTLLAKALAKSIGGVFKRVQFTPDLQPSDVTGFNVYNQALASFQFQPGPVMANVLLADEINRTIPRTQSSLLESMEERQVTVDGETKTLPSPFFVIATQNLIDSEGTFPLPEAQLDRFLLKLRLGYPNRDEEMAILERFEGTDPLTEIESVTTPEQVRALQLARRAVRVADPLRGYIADLVRATRDHPALEFGASPRGSMALMRAGQALAALRGRDYVLPDDIKALAKPVLCHRVIVKDVERMAGAEPDGVVQQVLDTIPVPQG